MSKSRILIIVVFIVITFFGVGLFVEPRNAVPSVNYTPPLPVEVSDSQLSEDVVWVAEKPQIENSEAKTDSLMPYAEDEFMISPALSISNPREVFEANYEQALEGDPDALYKIHLVALNCEHISPLPSLKEFYKYADEYNFFQAQRNVVSKLFDGCKYIAKYKPKGLTMTDWLYKLRDDAASQGSMLAKLSRYQWTPNSHEGYVEYAALLEAAVKTREPAAYLMAISFLNRYSPPDDMVGDKRKLKEKEPIGFRDEVVELSLGY